jgi:cysteinyl-tRNA synthetase
VPVCACIYAGACGWVGGCRIGTTEAAVHAALCDSVDTPTALAALADLIRHANAYVGAHPETHCLPLLLRAARYVQRILTVRTHPSIFSHPRAINTQRQRQIERATGKRTNTHMLLLQVCADVPVNGRLMWWWERGGDRSLG